MCIACVGIVGAFASKPIERNNGPGLAAQTFLKSLKLILVAVNKSILFEDESSGGLKTYIYETC